MHRLHVVGLPHTTTNREHGACAYTQKVWKFCKMMANAGHHVIHYGNRGSDPVCEENVIIGENAFPDHDYRKDYYPVEWDANLPYWRAMNNRAAAAISDRSRKGDFLCLIGGHAQKPIADALSGHPLLTVEYGIGYYGTFAKFRVFESYAHMHVCYGRESPDPDGKYFDAVIPNYFDPDDFTFGRHPTNDCLFVGRMVDRKGLQIAVEATKAAGVNLLMAGQGKAPEAPHVTFIGHMNAKRRSQVMRDAKVLIAPTIYTEPFGGVVVEAAFCGTPAVTTDWGAFTETVQHGVTGYRCRTLEQFVWAIKNAPYLDREEVYARAFDKYSLQVVAGMYNEYFDMLATLWGKGWYEEKPNRQNLNWLL